MYIVDEKRLADLRAALAAESAERMVLQDAIALEAQKIFRAGVSCGSVLAGSPLAPSVPVQMPQESGLVESALAAVHRAMLREDGLSIDNLEESHNLERDENSALRRHLLWLSQRPGVTDADRLALSRRIRDHGQDGIIEDSNEEDERAVLEVINRVERLCDAAEVVAELPIAEAQVSGETPPGRLPRYWSGRTMDLVRSLRSELHDIEPRTLAAIRRLGN